MANRSITDLTKIVNADGYPTLDLLDWKEEIERATSNTDTGTYADTLVQREGVLYVFTGTETNWVAFRYNNQGKLTRLVGSGVTKSAAIQSPHTLNW